jgi:hypothetical protein
MAVNDIWEVRVVTQQVNQIALNVLHYQVTAQVGADQSPLAVATRMNTWVRNEYIAMMTNTASYQGIYAQKIRPLPASAPASFTNSAPGSAGSQALPSQTCGLISIRGALAGRHNSGRTYIPFPDEADSINPNVPTAGYLTNAAVLMGVLAGPVTVTTGATNATLAQVIYNRTTGTAVLVTEGRVRPGWATQRRRGFFGASNRSPL